MYTIIWAIVLVVAIIAEFMTQQLVSIWFVIGSAVALMASISSISFSVQFIIFMVVSIIALVLTRPLVKKILSKGKTKTNADMVIGKTATVIESISSEGGTGRVKINGLDWKACSENSQEIIAGEKVKVLRIEGVTLIVEKQ
ncbi:MAG: NfeD family protein [Oscillospiraceae bacterium]